MTKRAHVSKTIWIEKKQ